MGNRQDRSVQPCAAAWDDTEQGMADVVSDVCVHGMQACRGKLHSAGLQEGARRRAWRPDRPSHASVGFGEMLSSSGTRMHWLALADSEGAEVRAGQGDWRMLDGGATCLPKSTSDSPSTMVLSAHAAIAVPTIFSWGSSRNTSAMSEVMALRKMRPRSCTWPTATGRADMSVATSWCAELASTSSRDSCGSTAANAGWLYITDANATDTGSACTTLAVCGYWCGCGGRKCTCCPVELDVMFIRSAMHGQMDAQRRAGDSGKLGQLVEWVDAGEAECDNVCKACMNCAQIDLVLGHQARNGDWHAGAFTA